MENKIVTLAIHTKGKALKLKQILESEGFIIYMEELTQDNNETKSYAIKIHESQVSKALTIVEESKLFNYNDKQTLLMDDGRKRILVAVDFSAYSMKACKVAFNIAKETNAKVKILHVYNNIYYPSHIPFADSLKNEGDIGILDKSRQQMLNLCLEIDKNITDGILPSINYSYSLREGIIEEEIEDFIKEYRPMLLVLGKRGISDNRKNILGSVTADIIEMTDVPVMVIPENSSLENIKGIKHLAFFTNVQKRDLTSFGYLVNHLIPSQKFKLTLVHIVEKGDSRWFESNLLELEKFFTEKYSGLNITYKIIDTTTNPDGVRGFVEDEKVEIVAVNTRHRNLWGRIFIPSSSRKILSSLDVVLLTLRGEETLYP